MPGTGAEDEVRALLSQLLEAQNAGDSERVRVLLSGRPGAVHIGTDGEEWWTSAQVADAVAAVGGADDIQAVADDVRVHVQGGRLRRRATKPWPGREAGLRGPGRGLPQHVVGLGSNALARSNWPLKNPCSTRWAYCWSPPKLLPLDMLPSSHTHCPPTFASV